MEEQKIKNREYGEETDERRREWQDKSEEEKDLRFKTYYKIIAFKIFFLIYSEATRQMELNEEIEYI